MAILRNPLLEQLGSGFRDIASDVFFAKNVFARLSIQNFQLFYPIATFQRVRNTATLESGAIADKVRCQNNSTSAALPTNFFNRACALLFIGNLCTESMGACRQKDNKPKQDLWPPHIIYQNQVQM